MRLLSNVQDDETTINVTFVFFSSRAQLVTLMTSICFIAIIFRNA